MSAVPTPLLLAVLLLAAPQADPGPVDEPSPAVAAAGSIDVDSLYVPPAVRPFEMPTGVVGGEVPAPGPTPAAAVRLDAYRRSYEGPKTATEQIYESGVRGAFESAQVRMGRLDGEWSVAGADGAPLIQLLLNDPGAGEIDGAWRDLRAGPGMFGSGLLLSVAREGATVVIRYAPREGEPACELRLRPGADGRFVGALRTAAGERSVVMTRT